MLVLSRKVGQTILVGNDLVLEIMKVQGGRVKIAIQAPSSVRIRRGELRPIEVEVETGEESAEDEEEEYSFGTADEQSTIVCV